MNEKVIVRDKSIIKIIMAIILCGVVLTWGAISLIKLQAQATSTATKYNVQIEELKKVGSILQESVTQLEEQRDAELLQVYTDGLLGLVLLLVGVTAAGLVIVLLYKVELVVTDKRIYKKTSFGWESNIPLDSVTSITKMSLLRGILIGSASGKIKFVLAEDVNEINEAIIELIIARQGGEEIEATPENNT